MDLSSSPSLFLGFSPGNGIRPMSFGLRWGSDLCNAVDNHTSGDRAADLCQSTGDAAGFGGQTLDHNRIVRDGVFDTSNSRIVCV